MLRSPEGLCHTRVMRATTRNRDFNGDDWNKNEDEWGPRESGELFLRQPNKEITTGVMK